MKTFVDPGAAFVPASSDRLRFLEEEHGFHREVVGDGTVIPYTGRETAVRVELEPRDDQVRVWLVRLVDRKLPPLFAYAPSHWLPLDDLEPSLRVARRLFGESFTAAELDRTLSVAAATLRRHAHILAGDHAGFEEHAR
ncbi:MAG: hypothetical protein ACR2L0_10115 [Gaiellaceae bacterium]